MREKIVKGRNGISLIVLIITIVAMLILISVTVVSVKNSIDNAEITNFANILTQVQDSVQTYYATNSEYPTPDSKPTAVVQSDFTNLADSRYRNALISELTLNGDQDPAVTTFYYIDLNKINVLKTSIGNGAKGANDLFLLAVPSLNVYYPRGISAKSQRFFSMSSNLTKQVNVSTAATTLDTSTTTANTYAGITVVKYNGWTSTMPLTVKSSMATDETLFISLSGATEKQLDFSGAGVYDRSFNLTELFSTNTILASGQTFSSEEISTFEALPQAGKYLEIIKKTGGVEIGRNRVELLKFEREVPAVDASFTINNYTNMNTISFSASDSKSGIKQIRYDYLTKIGEDGVEYQVYPGSTIDESYLKIKGKSLKVSSDGTYSIKIPKNISSIVVLVLDNAGNWVRKEQAITNSIYAGVVVLTANLDKVEVNVNSYSSLGTSQIVVSYSTDASTYHGEQVFTPNSSQNVVTQLVSFNGIKANQIYLKVVVTDNNATVGSRKTFTKVTPISIVQTSSSAYPSVKVGEYALRNSTLNGELPTYNNPVIPIGFRAIDTPTTSWPVDWNSGLVIEDIYANQFVWVPVDGSSLTYAKWSTRIATGSSATDDSLPAGITEGSQITKYQGFYYGRYEVSFDYNNGNYRPASKKSTNKTGDNWVASRDAAHTGYLWNYISYQDAKSYAANMASRYSYDPNYLATSLVTGTQYDTVCTWLANGGYNTTTDSRSWGNYNNSVSPANVTGYGSMQVSGYSDYWRAKNIYDMAGNLYEWNLETILGYYSVRSGYYGYSGNYTSYFDYTQTPASFRVGNTDGPGPFSYCGFRVALYIK